MTHADASMKLVEEGAAFEALSVGRPAPSRRERLDVVVIGGGQAGLSVGYHLSRSGLRFAILDASDRIGDAWRKRWDSLRLFTPAWLDSLDGLPFPAPRNYFPTKNEMGDYLEAYARHFSLPVRTGARVLSVSRNGEGYVVKTERFEIEADHIVVAMATYQKPRVPSFAKDLGEDVVQLHSLDYKSPSGLREGGVLIAGAGNSGAEIAFELAKRGHRVWMSGRDTGRVPFRIDSFLARLFLVRLLMRVVFHRVLTVRTRVGRKARPRIISKGGPLIRVKSEDLARLGVERTARIAGVKDGLPLLEDGRTLPVTNVIWCTGFDGGFSFVERPIFDDRGEPHHDEGVVRGEPGLYFVGLHFLYSMSSTMIHGVGRDAERIAGIVAERCRATKGAGQPHGLRADAGVPVELR